MSDDQFKRNIAFKLRVGDIFAGKPIFEGEKFSHLSLGAKKIVRVNVVGNIIERFDNDGERRFSVLNLDDGSGQLKLRIFSDDVDRFKNHTKGETVVVIGLLRNFNNELYVTPEIMRELDPRYLLVRKLELEKQRSTAADPIPKEEILAVKDRILGKIKNSEGFGGIDLDRLITELRDISPEIINQEVIKFIEEGIVFEPRPGKVRYLG